MDSLESLRYPVGRLQRAPAPLDGAACAAHIGILERTPRALREMTERLDEARLAASYRPGGWTVRQLVHHMADSHVNAYVRMKLAATEERPAAKTYEEGRWAELPEAKAAPIAMSLTLLDGLHERWVAFLRALSPEDRRRSFVHPEWGDVTIDEAMTMYSWHCRHHTAHIRIALRLPVAD
jgi:uncharacterized damage-inducible protein DinB